MSRIPKFPVIIGAVFVVALGVVIGTTIGLREHQSREEAALALGRFGGLYLILGSMPGFDLFRVPARWLIVAMIGVCLLAAFVWL